MRGWCALFSHQVSDLELNVGAQGGKSDQLFKQKLVIKSGHFKEKLVTLTSGRGAANFEPYWRRLPMQAAPYGEPAVQDGQAQQRELRMQERDRLRTVLQHQSVQGLSSEEVHNVLSNRVGRERAGGMYQLL